MPDCKRDSKLNRNQQKLLQVKAIIEVWKPRFVISKATNKLIAVKGPMNASTDSGILLSIAA